MEALDTGSQSVMNMNSEASDSDKSGFSKVFMPMLIIGTLFFVFGFVTWMNGSLIPFLKIACELNEFQAMWVAGAFYISYTVFALPSAAVLGKIGYKRGMVTGLGIMVVGALMFVPAAKIANYPLFLFAFFTLAAGLTLLQTAANPYIVCIGPRESAAMRISIMGLVNKGAGFIVPIIFTALVLTDMDRFKEDAISVLSDSERAARLAELSSRLIVPYIVLACSFVVFMFFVHFSSLPELEIDSESEEKVDDKMGVFRFPQLILGVIALFAYVGVEVIAGDTIGLYGQGLGVQNYGQLTSYTMAFMVLGYILGVVAIPKYMSQSRALILSAVLGLVFTAGVVLSSSTDTSIAQALFGWMGVPVVPNTVTFLALLGFANALVWPAVWPLALEGLGKYTSTASAFLIMSISGGAVLSLTYGYISDVTGDGQASYWLMIPCYAFILFYAFKGHKLRSWK